MNRTQRIILIVYFIAIILACIYVPWMYEMRGVKDSLGYSTIWSPPQHYAVVDYGRFALEILAITALGGMAFTLAGGFKRKIKEGE